MKLVDALGRRSRSVDKAPSGKTIVITAYDRAILDLLRRYRYLPSTWIIKLLQLDPQWAKRRLSQLRHDALLIECAKGTWGTNRYYQPAVYSLTPKGEALGTPCLKFGNRVKHDLLACLAMASLELGCREQGLKLYEWEHLQKREHCTTTEWKLALKQGRTLQPDWPPRAIGNTNLFYFYGVEIDRDTEPLKGEAHKTIERMYEDYFQILSSQSYKALGLPRILIPIITVNETRKRSLMEKLKEVAGDNSTKSFIFTTIPDILTDDFDFPAPSGFLLNQDWDTMTGTFNIIGTLNGHRETQPNSRTDRAEKED